MRLACLVGRLWTRSQSTQGRRPDASLLRSQQEARLKLSPRNQRENERGTKIPLQNVRLSIDAAGLCDASGSHSY